MASTLVSSQTDFYPIPVGERKIPGRVKSVPIRLHVDKYLEHRQAYNFIQEQQRHHNDGSRILVRALLYYRDNNGIENAASGPATRCDFPALPSNGAAVTKLLSARLYIDRYVEHREAYQLLLSAQESNQDVLKMIVCALLSYRDNVVHRPLPPLPKIDNSKTVQLRFEM